LSHKKFYTIWGTILVLGVVLIISYFSTVGSANQLQAQSIKEAEGLEVNNQFVIKFFNYESTRQRYEAVESLMTEKGYLATYPSGFELPADSSVKSSIRNLKSFVQKSPVTEEDKMEILNEFVVITEFNDIKSSKEVIMRTQLVFSKDSGWKVDDIEMIVQN
jgi:hypothetical protein